MDMVENKPRVRLPVLGKPSDLGDIDVEAELKKFELEQMAILGLQPGKEHWRDEVPSLFTKKQREHTTLLLGGLTMAHDQLISAGLSGIGYKVFPLDPPDNAALTFGKEFGNRAQCNPTYFTVGNLIKHLTYLRDEKGLSKDEIVGNYLFVTAGACGPCRFGTYVTEYRKALRDSGFDGFRVMLFQQQGGLKQATGDDVGLEMNPQFFLKLLLGIFIGDVLNLLCYRTRPYEVEKGATDRAMEASKKVIANALAGSGNIVWALIQARRNFSRVEVDRSIIKPKVSVIGEFWAMTTEGDGNYQLQRFLEAEGAELDIQTVTAWILFLIWEQRYDTEMRQTLREDDVAKKGLAGKNPQKKILMLHAANQIVRVIFHAFANIMGLHGYHLPDMDLVSEVSKDVYNNNLRGGEAHMEVGKLVLNVMKKKATMTVSVKPFGCMPSSGVSDGVQSYITEKFAGAIFCAIETNGDAPVNVYSRVQMMLFKARRAAQDELAKALEEQGLTMEQFKARLAAKSSYASAFFYPHHVVASTAANTVHELTRPGLLVRLRRQLTVKSALESGRSAVAGVTTAAPKVLEFGKAAARELAPKVVERVTRLAAF